MNYNFKIKFNELPVLVKCGLRTEVDLSLHQPFSLLKNDRAEVVSHPPEAHGKGSAYSSFYSSMSSHAVKFSFVPKFTILFFLIQVIRWRP